MAEIDDGEGIGGELWKKFQNEFVFAKYTPFFVSLASGHLDSKTFRHCLSQEAHILDSFTDAFRLAGKCADDEEDKISIRKLRENVKERLRKHKTLLLEWGFEVSEDSSKDQATTNYTDFLHATSLGKAEGEKVSSSLATPFEKTKIAAYTLGAIAPCMRFYASISHEILCHLNPDDENNSIYKKWINNYCSQNLQESGLQIENLLDRLSITLTGEELKVIDKLYHQALKLQVEFFAAQPLVQKTIVPLSRGQGRLFILSDFDLTCTKFDSSATLAELALVTAPKIQSDRAEGQAQLTRMPSSELKKTWDFLSTQYAEEYTQCIERILLNDKVESFSYEKLCEALKLLEDFEKAANKRIVETGVLKGLHVDGIKHVGRNLVLQEGFKGFFAKVVKNEDLKPNVRILSYCWSGDLIRSAFSSDDLDGVKVHSNELVYEDSISTGEMINAVESPIEKLELFNDTVEKRCDNHRTVYIGGSVGDLLCLLEADIGIVINPTTSLMTLAAQFGISFVPLFDGIVKKQRNLDDTAESVPIWKGLSGILYTVSSWFEVDAFILGS